MGLARDTTFRSFVGAFGNQRGWAPRLEAVLVHPRSAYLFLAPKSSEKQPSTTTFILRVLTTGSTLQQASRGLNTLLPFR